MKRVLRTIAAFLAAAGLACATAPAAEQLRPIAPGVSVLGIHVGGLTAAPAGTAIAAAFSKPIVIAGDARGYTVSTQRFDTHAGVNAAVEAALAATPKSRIGMPVSFSQRAIEALVDDLAKSTYRPPRNAAVIGAGPTGRPMITPDRPGLAVQKAAMVTALAKELKTGSRAPVELVTGPVPAKVTVADVGSIVIIDRGTNTLRLFNGRKLVRTFRVATGQAVYPTPVGFFEVVKMERNPWWYPPTYSDWAKGLKPVPPGPSNPLGTRWMGISAPGVGMHGTYSDSSIGYSLSHGCIRMHVPDAEWLFERVKLGTPVAII